MFLFNESRVVAILVDEDCAAVVVEGFPEKGFLGEAEDEEITRSGAFSEDVGDGFELGVGHMEGVVGFGGVVKKGINDSGRERGGGGGGSGRGGDEGRGGGGDGSSGCASVDKEEKEEEGESEEGEEGKKPYLGGSALFLDVRMKENEPCVIGIGFHF